MVFLFWGVSARVEQANHERRLASDRCRCTGVVTCNALGFPWFTFSQGMIFLSLEFFNTDLLDLRQPMSNVARKRSTEAVGLCKGIQACTPDF